MGKLLALCTACCLALTACALPEDSFLNKETVSAVVDGGTQLVSMLAELRATYDSLTADGEVTEDDINIFLAKTDELGIDMSEAQEMLDALEKAKEASEMAEELQKKMDSGEINLKEDKTDKGKDKKDKKSDKKKNKKNKKSSSKLETVLEKIRSADSTDIFTDWGCQVTDWDLFFEYEKIYDRRDLYGDVKSSLDAIDSWSPEELEYVKENYSLHCEIGNNWDDKTVITFIYFTYIGDETDGSKIKLPPRIAYLDYMFKDNKNLKSAPKIPKNTIGCASMFYGCKKLKKAPVVPKSVKRITHMFEGCSKKVQKAGEWNLQHRGKSYYKDR